MGKLFAYLRIMRPANIVTSVADILAGIAISGVLINNGTIPWLAIICLCLSTACLYAGGIVFNDVFDAELDKIERPERAIPSGIISLTNATILGAALMISGIALASLTSLTSGLFALAVSFFALLYNKIGKQYPLFGPLNMGICRGLNLLLGLSIVPVMLHQHYFLAVIPVIYIFSITMTSRGEVHGGNIKNLYVAAILYAIVIGAIACFAFLNDRLLWSLLFLLPFAWMIFKPLSTAIKNPIGKNIGGAVKAGVISLILMDAAWAVTFDALILAFIIAALLPLSMWLSKLFAVT
ncbi:UbiA-like protein EboC [Pedobacter aquatilis]|uniref:UbiA-like protein EboC n=1 Tax=Pedobacter aquatilis TaxID=351343 RepID=UPI0025B3B991|nr:UbiA-like protein EboC [Pedobacter aquatilis]MDN3585959.1 UbiA-like protein EboC [Pedobacter aquatilis]